MQFNWTLLKRVAALPIPRPDPGILATGSVDWRAFKNEYETIMLARTLLAARHDGRKSTDTFSVDPIPPEPMTRADDFKRQ